MHPFTNQLHEKLDNELRDVRSSEKDLFRQLGRSIKVCREALERLKEWLASYQFESTGEEIYFFKFTYPSFYSRFIYYVNLFAIESERPAGSYNSRVEYFREWQQQTDSYFERNRAFHQYMRTGATHFDEIYFLRSSAEALQQPDDLALAIDSSFCTLYSYNASKLLASEQLVTYINSCIDELTTIKDGTTGVKKSVLQWTGTKIALIELIYALHSTGVLNNGNADVKLITGQFENIFQIELGNVYNVFQEMRMRKKNRTSFLDLMRARLVQRMEEMD